MRPPVKLTDAQVQAATGKTWGQWIAVVSEIEENQAAVLRTGHGLDTWWSEVIAAQCTKPNHRVRVTRTIEGSLRKLFQACRGAGWGMASKPANPDKPTLEATFPDGSHVTLRLREDGNKTRITADHSRLIDPQSAEKMRNYWTDSLNKLRQEIER